MKTILINLKNKIKTHLKHILIALVLVTLIISGIVVKAGTNNNDLQNVNTKSDDYLITVHITGEVHYPGTYQVSPYTDVSSLIVKAHGLTEYGETSYINLNKIVEPNETIYIPKKEITKIKKRININNATLEQLITLTGIGKEKASSIILYRTNNGPFNYIDDLLNVPGINNTILLSIKDEIKLS